MNLCMDIRPGYDREKHAGRSRPGTYLVQLGKNPGEHSVRISSAAFAPPWLRLHLSIFTKGKWEYISCLLIAQRCRAYSFNTSLHNLILKTKDKNGRHLFLVSLSLLLATLVPLNYRQREIKINIWDVYFP